MLNQKLQLKLSQKLSPQQIQLMKLIQLTTAELEQKIKNEIEENPALEMGSEKTDADIENDEFEVDKNEDVNVDDFLTDMSEDYDHSQNYYSSDEDNTSFQTKASYSFHQYLDNQSKNLILKLKKKIKKNFFLLVSGSHLSKKNGKTINEILNDGIKPDFKLDILKEKISLIKKSKLSHIQKIYYLISDCKRYGTLPFAKISLFVIPSSNPIKLASIVFLYFFDIVTITSASLS